MRRALLHRVHERSPAFNHATYAEIKYSTARTPGPTAPRPRDPQLWMEMDRCVATSRYPVFKCPNFNENYSTNRIFPRLS